MEDGYQPATDVEQRILFVEDLSADVELSVRELKRSGIPCVVRQVETELDFRRELEQFSPDLIISDFSIPGFQGMDALMIARDLCPDTPYIFVSGTIGEETAIESLKLGATDYVLKSNLQRLGPSVLRALQESRERAARAEMSEALKNSEERFRQLAESIHEVFWLTDLTKNQMLYISPAYEEIWGRNCSQLYASPWEWADALHPDDRERVLSAVKTKQVNGSYEEEYRVVRPDGSVRWVRDRAFPIADKEGRVFRIAGIADDITERKRSEEKLRESEVKFRQLIEQASDGIMISDKYGNFVLVNTRACELLGYTEEEIIGLNGRETYVEGDKGTHAERMQSVRNGEALRFERMVRRKDGSAFPAEVSIKMLDTSQVQVIFHDITTRRAHEQKIARLSRIQSVLSGINSAIVRIRDRKELFEEACQIAVKHGGFRMAWIGLIDRVALQVERVAHAGFEEGFLSEIAPLTFDAGVHKKSGALAEAVTTKSPKVVNDIATDAGILYREEHLSRGYRSAILLPLMAHGEAVGLLALYAGEKDIFDEEELKLLTDLSADVSFALEYLGKSEELDFLAHHDALTGLPNRTLYLERLGAALQAARETDKKVAVIFGDIKRFRYVNDTFGRRAGDALLCELSERLRRVWPYPESIARVSADCFAAILPDAEGVADIATLIDHSVAASLSTPFMIDGKEIQIALTGGVTVFPGDGEDTETLSRNAEAAMKMAKLSGERYLFYQHDMTARTTETLLLENRMRKALENEQFVLHYQPKIDSTTRKLAGLEALIRWNDPDTGLVPPSKFIPVLEETGLILQVGTWAIRRALEDMRAWKADGFKAPRIAVNVSALQLQQKNFVDVVKKALRAYGGGLCQLDIEITESLIMQNIEANTSKLAALRDMGIMISIDDFGTGYSSLGYLAKLPVNALKIDRSFISTMASNPDSATIVSTIISLAHSLSMKVIAEGVETDEQWKFLKLLKCDEIQGFLISQPLPAERVPELLEKAQNPRSEQ